MTQTVLGTYYFHLNNVRHPTLLSNTCIQHLMCQLVSEYTLIMIYPCIHSPINTSSVGCKCWTKVLDVYHCPLCFYYFFFLSFMFLLVHVLYIFSTKIHMYIEVNKY